MLLFTRTTSTSPLISQDAMCDSFLIMTRRSADNEEATPHSTLILRIDYIIDKLY